jgi:hypothetical protein
METPVLNAFFVTETVPAVGMDATVCYVTDRVSTTIVGVPNAKTVETWDGKRVVGWTFVEGQEMFFDDTPLLSVWTLRKNGRWIAKGSPMERGATHLLVGVKDDYRDPSF